MHSRSSPADFSGVVENLKMQGMRVHLSWGSMHAAMSLKGPDISSFDSLTGSGRNISFWDTQYVQVDYQEIFWEWSAIG